ncbi:MAG TPA: Txe/YoeB family addiction module toxin [Saprospiraceae bacterium]|nr:Txe/YoeB family addiction module toxin [Saprospiraceae bacterium]HRO73254.1 Txe/YoeB family addiction module toxin [Saprospiraceae bacterium]HRP41911.1 Txe/YoeB family addiction module toxin [Saprospiraceae bacterium]
MKYTIIFQTLALNEIKIIKKSGRKMDLIKLDSILEELKIHPRTGTGNPEQLKHQLSGFWSRRINKKDRLIYEIIEEPERLVVIISALGHY